MRNYNDSNYLFSVEWCRVNYIDISIQNENCQLRANLYSTELMITGLVSNNPYIINIGASNAYGSSFGVNYAVFAGSILYFL